MQPFIDKADILIEALPYIQEFRGKVFVVKYGGSSVDNAHAVAGILHDLVFLSTVGIQPVLVHGGGPEITRRLKEAGVESRFVRGLRVTDARTISVVSEALESVNEHLVDQIHMMTGHAEGLTWRQQVIIAQPHAEAKDLGFVGEVKAVHSAPIREVFASRAIPVIAPVGVAEDGQLYNINADDVACAVAAHLEAEKLVLLTDVRGVMRDPSDPGSLISTIGVDEVAGLVESEVIKKGMIPKMQACVGALRNGVNKTHIIDASMPHAMLLEIFTKQGIGTEIVH